MGRVRCVLAVKGLDCATEVAALRTAIEGAPGVLGLGFDLIEGTMTVDYDPAMADPATLVARIAGRAGMSARLLGEADIDRPASGWRATSVRWAVTIASGLALLSGVAASASGASDHWTTGLYALAIAMGAADIMPKALRALRGRRIDIHTLMSTAVVGAIVLGQWDEAATVAFLFLLSEALESYSLDRARRAVRSLLEIAPETAEVFSTDGGTRVVPARDVQVAQRVRVRAYERIPVDGRIVSGHSSIDQKAITGESVPVPRGVGEEVYAGSVNGEGSLEVEATRLLGDSVITRIVEQVRAAQSGRAPIEQSLDRFAAVYTPAVVALAAFVMVAVPLATWAMGRPVDMGLWRAWFLRGLVVLVVSCPCALIIGTPVAIVCGLATAARRGILVKGGQFLEAFGRLRVLAFDKTGTLTVGEPSVVEVVPVHGRAGEDLLRIAAALGDRGGHVLGRAIARHARGLQLDVPPADDYQAVPGLGATGQVEATRYHIGSHRYIDQAGQCQGEFHRSFGAAEGGVGTSVALTAATGPLGWIRLADRPRDEAAHVLAELRGLGIETVMLTGDNRPTAAAMARELGIGDHRAELLPADKAEAVAQLDARRGPTGMVGDGVNDAPALAAARVSVALGGISSGAALETADIVLMGDDLTGLPWLVRHSRRTLERIRQNIALAVGSKALVMALAVGGYASLWMAIAADLGVSLLVVANALQLLWPHD
jgi:Cd2+/Zn2+-exporting ATPase